MYETLADTLESKILELGRIPRSKLARRPHKELDFCGEQSIHADVVGGLKGKAPTAKAPRLNCGALGGVSAAHGARILNRRYHPMAKSHSVNEPRRADAVERSKHQRRPKATHKSVKAKAPKRQKRSKSAVRSRGRVKPAAAKTKKQDCLDLLNRPEGATVEELQAATGWQQHSVRGFLAGAVK